MPGLLCLNVQWFQPRQGGNSHARVYLLHSSRVDAPISRDIACSMHAYFVYVDGFKEASQCDSMMTYVFRLTVPSRWVFHGNS